MQDRNKPFWPGWETVQLIGRGSFGAVYEIERDVLGDTEKAALKVISIPQNEGDIETLYEDGFDAESITSTFQSHLKSIVAEYTLMKKMSNCTNIVHCDDVRYVQHEDGIGWDIFIKMELLTPLMKALPTEITDEVVYKVAKDMCNALIMCKELGIIHRDIKPQNIFMSPWGDYKLGDFGIAKTVEKTMGGTKIGTYKFMAPEVFNNQPYGMGADIYSLGLVLYWMLNKRRMPFMPLPPEKVNINQESEARHRRLSGEPLPAPATGCADLKKIVLKACAYEPKERYQSAAEMLRELNEGFGSEMERRRKEEEERQRQEREERERLRRFREEQERLRKAQEEKLRKEREEQERLVRESAERERLRRQHEEQERLRREKEAQEQRNRAAQTAAKTQGEAKKKQTIIIAAACVLLVLIGFIIGANGSGKSAPTAPAQTTVQSSNNPTVQKTETNKPTEIKKETEPEKKTGWQTINGDTYYFDDNGEPHSGWLTQGGKKYYCSYVDGKLVKDMKWEVDGNGYYFDENGVMQTGRVEIYPGYEYVFDDNGRFQYCDVEKYLPATLADDSVNIMISGGYYYRTFYLNLDTPAKNVTSLRANVQVGSVISGDCDGKWQLHVRTLDGEWKWIEYFEVTNGKGSLEITLDKPISFDAYQCTRYSSKNPFEGSHGEELYACYRSYDFWIV